MESMFRWTRTVPVSAAAAVLLVALSACAADGTEDTDEGAEAPAEDTDAEETDEAEETDDAEESASALDFEAATLGGEDFSGSELQGETAVLWFWSPFCTICRGEAGGVAEAGEQYSDEVEFLGVAGHGGIEAMQDFVDDTGADTMTHLADEEGEVWSEFEVVGHPAFAFLHADGTHTTVSGTLTEEELNDHIEEALAASGRDES